MSFESVFEPASQEILSVAFEYVGNNDAEVENIYAYTNFENSTRVTEIFYRINGRVVEQYAVNQALTATVEESDERQLGAQDLIGAEADRIKAAFEAEGREVPAEMFLEYDVSAQKFGAEFGYDKKIPLDDPAADYTTPYNAYLRSKGGAPYEG